MKNKRDCRVRQNSAGEMRNNDEKQGFCAEMRKNAGGFLKNEIDPGWGKEKQHGALCKKKEEGFGNFFLLSIGRQWSIMKMRYCEIDVYMTVIASQCAHWRGNLLSFPGTFHGTFPKIHEIATPACGLVRNDT